MRLKNRDVIDVVTAITALSKEQLPIRLSWRIETASRALSPFHLAAMEAIDKIKMSKALKDPEGNFVLATDEKGNKVPGTLVFDNKEVAEVNKVIHSLLDEEVEIDNVEIRISDFPDTLEVSPDSLSGLNTLLK
jgi:hypothetical protein